MRILSSLLLTVGMLFMLAAPQQASATAVGLVPLGGTAVCTVGGGTGGEDTCVGAASDTLTFAITMVVDAAGVNGWSVDLAWDQGLENALTLTGNADSGSGFSFPNPSPPPTSIGYTGVAALPVQQSSASLEGRLDSATGAVTQDFTLTLSSASFRAATVTFDIDSTDETNVTLGFFRTDGAVMGNSASQFITPTFGSWVINQVPESGPEPGTSLLMGLGLFGLAFAARRTRG